MTVGWQLLVGILLVAVAGGLAAVVSARVKASRDGRSS